MDINLTLQNLRVAYLQASLDVSECNPNPELQFEKWIQEAISSQCDEPNAFTLSTIHNGQPRGRVVLLKGIENSQFHFYTNYQSSKGIELSGNSRVAMTFLWLPLHRQVRIEGIATKADAQKSDSYFHKRPRGSQIGALASPQSQKVSSRAELEKLFVDAEAKYSNVDQIPRPKEWGGYGIAPTYFEFWQGRDNRMHDRVSYELKNGEWILSRLAP